MERRARTTAVPLLLVALALLGASCHAIVDPPLPAGAVPLAPRSQYRMWWELASQCAGLSRSFDAVQWYVVPGAGSIQTSEGDLDGAYYRVENRIVLAERAIDTGRVVRHEMLHALLRAADAHPATYFQRRCAGIVSCDGPCAREIDPSPIDAAAPRVAPRALSLNLTLLPASGALHDSNGWYVAIVSVTNPRTTAVRVALPPKGVGQYLSFAYADDCGSSTLLAASETIDLAPGETRAHAFDHRWCAVGAGELIASGAVGGDSTAVRRWPVQP
jgi:hypothetical protein